MTASAAPIPPTCRCVEARRVGNGFSLVELLVVIAIMAILASIGMPLAELSHQRSKEEDLRRALREIRDGLDTYKRLVDEGRIPRAADASGYPPQLDLLATGIPDAKSAPGTMIYILRRLPRDPLAKEEGPAASTWGVRSYASPADDPRPGKDVFDVFSMAPGRGLNGQPYGNW